MMEQKHSGDRLVQPEQANIQPSRAPEEALHSLLGVCKDALPWIVGLRFEGGNEKVRSACKQLAEEMQKAIAHAEAALMNSKARGH